MISGVGSAINGEICSSDVRGLQTGDEGYQRGDLVDTPVTVERGNGLLRCCPIGAINKSYCRNHFF